MKHKKADRYSHTGKSYQDKEVYKNFLSSKFNLDKTEDDPVDPTKTNESSSEEEKIYTPKTQKKSTSLAIKDFVNNNWSITIIGGIVVGVIILVVTLVLNGYTLLNREQGVQTEKICGIQKNIETLSKNSEENKNNFYLLKGDFNIFKTEVSKDLTFIKDELKTQSGTDKKDRH